MSGFRIRSLLSFAACLSLCGCDLVRSFPVITPDPIGFGSLTVGKVLTANITQRGGRMATPDLIVNCDVSLRLTPSQASPVTRIVATQGAGNQWSCALPPSFDAAIHPNQLLQLQWLVRSAQTTVADSGVIETMIDCPNPAGTLAAEQGAVLGAFPAALTFNQIVARGFVPTHGATSFAGMGVAFIRASAAASDASNVAESAMANLPAPTPGAPDLLLFAPTGPVGAVTDPLIADNPYVLVGWAYAQTIRPRSGKPTPPSGARAPGLLGLPAAPAQPRPVMPCIPHHEWFMHSSGFHEASGGFTPAASPIRLGGPAVFHPDIWDIHFFVGAGGVPRIGITRPTGPAVVGITAPANSFYYTTAYD
jgi:hypothetical protein